MRPIKVKRNKSGQFRAWGMFLEFGTSEPARVWIGSAPPGDIFEDTVLTLKDASGRTIEVLAGEQGLILEH